MRANRGAAGIDQETIAAFEKNLSRNEGILFGARAGGSAGPQCGDRSAGGGEGAAAARRHLRGAPGR